MYESDITNTHTYIYLVDDDNISIFKIITVEKSVIYNLYLLVDNSRRTMSKT